MKKFQQNVSRELRRAYPDRRRLECQCLSAIGFVKNEPDMLDSPIWVLIINVVAMDMLKSKLPPSKWFSSNHVYIVSPSFESIFRVALLSSAILYNYTRIGFSVSTMVKRMPSLNKCFYGKNTFFFFYSNILFLCHSHIVIFTMYVS